jgi:hypothetical protein
MGIPKGQIPPIRSDTLLARELSSPHGLKCHGTDNELSPRRAKAARLI